MKLTNFDPEHTQAMEQQFAAELAEQSCSASSSKAASAADYR
jgi:hypothetical protein